MRITDEYIAKEKAFAQKNYDYCVGKGPEYVDLAQFYNGELSVWTQLEMRKLISGRTLYLIGVKGKLRRFLVNILGKCLDYLRGVEAEDLKGQDPLEKRSYENLKKRKRKHDR